MTALRAAWPYLEAAGAGMLLSVALLGVVWLLPAVLLTVRCPSWLASNARVYLRCLRRRTGRWRRGGRVPVWVLRLATWRKVRRFGRTHPAITDRHEKCPLTPGEHQAWAAMTREAKR